MIEQYKVLGGMLALGEFTVADLAAFSGVKETTVRTVLGRNAALVDRREPSGARARRGGQPRRYVLRDDASDEIRRQLQELYISLSPQAMDAALDGVPGDKAPPPTIAVPLGLAAAQAVFEHEFHMAQDPSERDRALRVARAALENGMAELSRWSAHRGETPEMAAAVTLAASVRALLQHVEVGTPKESEAVPGSALPGTATVRGAAGVPAEGSHALPKGVTLRASVRRPVPAAHGTEGKWDLHSPSVGDAEPQEGERQGPWVVLVEYEDQLRRAMKDLLEGHGYTVAEAHDGVQALDQVARFAPELIVLDFDLPGLDGYGVLSQLRSSRATRDIPVIVISAKGDDEKEALALKPGAVSLTTKPLETPALSALGAVLGRRRD